MTSSLLSALNVLIKPEASVQDVQSSQQDSLLAALRTNRTLLLQRLQGEEGRGSEEKGRGFEEVRRLREEVMASALWFSSHEEDIAWAFVQECLLLLLALTRHLSAELRLFSQSPAPSAARLRTPEMAPPLPPDVLSVSQQKTLAAALQFVVSLGLSPYLAAGVGLPLGQRSTFGAMVEQLVHGGAGPGQGAGPTGSRRLLTTTSVLLQMSELSSLASLLFSRHLGDVMAALSQLGHRPRPEGTKKKMQDPLSDDERRSCREALKNLLGKVYQPMVIKELLVLQGGARQSCPAWLRRLCGRLLSERLMQPKGVQAVVRAVLEAGTGGDTDWRKCDSVAKILVTCPQLSESEEEYYAHICPQILDLLHFRDKLTAQQFQRVATRAALSVVEKKPSMAQRFLLLPLLEPLQRCSSASREADCEVAVEEWELTRCVDDVYKIWVVGNTPSAPLLQSLQEVLPVVFSLFCFTKHNVSHLRAPCQEILLWFLSHAEPSAGLSALRRLSGLQDQDHQDQNHQKQVSAGFQFTPGSDGGARLSSRTSTSDEDDSLYEKLSEEQWQLQCLMQLLSDLNSDLPGEFFLQLLQELTSWTEEEEEQQEEMKVSSLSLLEVEQHGGSDRLTLLQVLAVMVECVQHSVLIRKNTQVVDFILTLLQRACVGLDQASGPGPVNPVESQTLSMGMGLVATLLSGPQLSAEDFSSLSKLLSPLQTLSQNHPDPFVQELASNLRAVIATHGAWQPGNLHHADANATAKADAKAKANANAAQNPRDSETRLKSSSLPSKKKTKTETEAKDSTGVASSAPPPPNKSFSDWLLEACDPDVPTRAVALRFLTRLVQGGDPEAVQEQEKLLTLFLENLEHEDSFIYLSAVQGLVVLADSYPDRILQRLLSDFQHGSSLPTSDQQRSLETRLKLGEVLMRTSRALGDLAPHLGRPLISVFLQGSRDQDPSIRASSLSNLGEICQRLDYAVGPLAQELSCCLTALIKTEREVEVRRAAVHVIVLLLRGLSDKTTQVLADVLLDLYRALKWVVRSDPDQVSVLQAQLALEELDHVMRSFIFPQQKLEKKIVVLP